MSAHDTFGEKHIIVVDLGFGDAGKGATVDALCAELGDVSCVVRYNGGSQAAHNVVVDGVHHMFSQFGAGTFSNVPTFLSSHMMVEPFWLANEAERLIASGIEDPFSLMHVDARALLTTPIHAAANKVREKLRGRDVHGSCGRGIGETMAYALNGTEDMIHMSAPRIRDCLNPERLRLKLQMMLASYEVLFDGRPDKHLKTSIDEMMEVYELFAEKVHIVNDGITFLQEQAMAGRLVFEGAQGVLLDEWKGFHPYTTWSTTTPANAHKLLKEADVLDDPYVLGVTRTYSTRHGAGPFPTENSALSDVLEDTYNVSNPYQNNFRVGDLDMILMQYAIKACGGLDAMDGLSLTHLDAISAAVDAGTPIKVATEYRITPAILQSGIMAVYRLGNDAALETITALEGAYVRMDVLDPSPSHNLDYQAVLTALLEISMPLTRNTPPTAQPYIDCLELHTKIPVVLTSNGPARNDRVFVNNFDMAMLLDEEN